MTDTYTGPRADLHAALTAAQPSPLDYWTLSAEQRHERQREAIARLNDVLAGYLERGYRTAQMIALALADSESHPGDRAVPDYSSALHYGLLMVEADAEPPAAGDDALWCETCRTRRRVTDRSEESHYQRHGEIGFLAVQLACGHAREFNHHLIGAAPGGESLAEDQAARALRDRQARQDGEQR